MEMNFSTMLIDTMLDTNPAAINNRMANLYRQLQLKAWFSRLAARLTGRSYEILSLDDALQHQSPRADTMPGCARYPSSKFAEAKPAPAILIAASTRSTGAPWPAGSMSPARA